jgi:uncharacterized protein
VKILLLALLVGLGFAAPGAETIPPQPKAYFNDYAGVVTPATVARLNQTLENFERETSNQILVAIFPKMQSESAIEDYTVRVKEAWKVGQKNKNNGAVLFVFTQDRKMFLQVGYGLEGVLPDALCKRIIEDEIKPAFKSGDFDAGLTAGVTAMLAATRGEYQGTGATHAETRGGADLPPVLLVVAVVMVLLLVISLFGRSRGRYYRSSGWSGSGWGGGISWGGGGGGGSSGGFSGGGGSGGGGGAGGSW